MNVCHFFRTHMYHTHARHYRATGGNSTGVGIVSGRRNTALSLFGGSRSICTTSDGTSAIENDIEMLKYGEFAVLNSEMRNSGEDA